MPDVLNRTSPNPEAMLRLASYVRSFSWVAALVSRQRFTFLRLCGTQSISQFSSVLNPPLDHALTWSASISDGL